MYLCIFNSTLDLKLLIQESLGQGRSPFSRPMLYTVLSTDGWRDLDAMRGEDEKEGGRRGRI